MKRKLTDTKITKAVTKDNDYKLSDGGGLFLHVKSNGSKLWSWQYRFDGVPKLMALGAYPDLSLGEARNKHDELRRIAKGGVDPMAIRKVEKSLFTQNPANAFTRVEIVADADGNKTVRTTPLNNSFLWVERQWYEKWSSDKDPTHAAAVAARVERDILPPLGHRPIAEIEAPEIASVALAIQERGALDVAHRSLNTMGQIFRFGISRGYCRRNPAAEIKAGDFLKGRTRKNFARVDQKEIPDLLWAIHHYNGMPVTRIMLKLMVRVWVRTSELILTPWSEFTFKDGRLSDTVWTIPASRMKKVKGHPSAGPSTALTASHRPDRRTVWLHRQHPVAVSRSTRCQELHIEQYDPRCTRFDGLQGQDDRTRVQGACLNLSV